MKNFIFSIFIFIFLFNYNVFASTPTVVMESSSGRILYQNDSNSRHLIASITKIMTCIVTLENIDINKTVEVGDEIGSEEASTIINDIKTEVIKEQPETEEEIKEIVENITNQYNVNISVNAKDSIVNLMSDVNDLDLDYSELKNSLKEASNKLSNNLKELGIKLKEEGFFEKIKNWSLVKKITAVALAILMGLGLYSCSARQTKSGEMLNSNISNFLFLIFF